MTKPGQQIPDTNSSGTKINSTDPAQLNDSGGDLNDYTETRADFDDNDNGFGDDFDEFKEGAGGNDHDDFGDFDDGFQEPEETSDASILKPNTDSTASPSLPVLVSCQFPAFPGLIVMLMISIASTPGLFPS